MIKIINEEETGGTIYTAIDMQVLYEGITYDVSVTETSNYQTNPENTENDYEVIEVTPEPATQEIKDTIAENAVEYLTTELK